MQYTFGIICFMADHHETRYSEWHDKPERPSRPASFTGRKRPAPVSNFVWRHLLLIVLLMFAFVLSLVYLAKHL
jgi:hypothetical protein